MKILILAEDPSFGAAANLVKALRKEGHSVGSIFLRKDPKGFWEKLSTCRYIEPIGDNQKVVIYDQDCGFDHLIFVGSNAFESFPIPERKTPTTVILTDSHYLRNYERLNLEFDAAGVNVMAMPDLMPYRQGRPTAIYYPPFNLCNYKRKKNDHFTICHSPGPKDATNEKGTFQIREQVQRFLHKNPGAEYIEITGKTHAESIEIKSKAHVFIDQLVPPGVKPNGYAGGLGKSGVEAMQLSCYTITNQMEHGKCLNYFNPETETMADHLQHVFDNRKELSNRAKAQLGWSKHHTTFDMVALNVLKTIQNKHENSNVR
jgi:hypothetical protein